MTNGSSSSSSGNCWRAQSALLASYLFLLTFIRLTESSVIAWHSDHHSSTATSHHVFHEARYYMDMFIDRHDPPEPNVPERDYLGYAAGL
ncbi:hypothetical protein FPOAC1_001960 [Fusarium poae]|uniref:hypothetical protein n=1 Tax=Fusarium poae TaxID=36050 RepID=UPI001CE88249|nr:hypothetical protein FPOAC1_001960 [Fusarium poae]KAG8675964.1 hypothetical protein FPOAC1_001960 [Fusarium poae]